jgi:hypothetical protein
LNFFFQCCLADLERYLDIGSLPIDQCTYSLKPSLSCRQLLFFEFEPVRGSRSAVGKALRWNGYS